MLLVGRFGQVESCVIGHAAVGKLLKQAGENPVGLGRLVGIEKGIAPLGQQRVAADAGFFEALARGLVAHQLLESLG